MEAWDRSNAKRDKKGEVLEVNAGGAAARLLVKILEGEDGQRAFADDQVEVLNALDYDVLNRLSGVALRLAGRAGDDAKKNSPATTDGDSSSASPASSTSPT